MKSEIVIVGAGIVGAACARALAIAGHEVLVIDAQGVGGGATAAGMGHIVVMDDSEAQLALTRYSQQLWNEVFPQLPDDCEVDHCGTLWVAADEEEMEEVHRKHVLFGDHGITTEIIDAKGLREIEPRLREGLAGGLRCPRDSVIYPPCAARWLLEQAQRAGAQVRFGSVVKDLSGEGALLSDETRISAGAVVNATGSWATRLLPDLPMRAKKGHLVITDRYPGFVSHQILELGYLKSAHQTTGDSVAFNVQPRKTGQLLIGSSRQLDREDRQTDREIVRKMLARAVSYLPGLSSVSAVRTWTGLRAATPDSLPLIGPHPEMRNLYLATGHEGLGITTSLATAEILASYFTNGSLPIAREPYARMTR